MQDAEDEGKVHAGHQGPTGAEGSVLTYVTEAEFRKQRSRSPSCNSLNKGQILFRVQSKQKLSCN